MKIVERIEGHYEAHDVPYGRAYRWRPERVVVECRCGRRETYKKARLLESVVRCESCKDHSTNLREELVFGVLEDEVLHPWRYWRAPESESLPV